MKPDLLPVSSCANRLAVVSFGLAMLGFSAQPARATLWTGSANDQNWATAGNWNSSYDSGSTPPADGNSIWLDSNATLANHPIFTAAQGTLSVKDIYMYGNPGSHLDQTGGSLTTGFFGMATDAGSSATFNLSDGTFASTGELQVGVSAAGTLNQTGGTLNSSSYLVVGRNSGSVGVFSLSGGKVNGATTGGFTVIGSFGGSNGTLNVSGSAELNSPLQMRIGEEGTGTLNQTGGTVSVGGVTYVGWGKDNTSTQNGTFTVSGGTFTSEGDLELGRAGGSTAQANVTVDGGTLNVGTNTKRWLIVSRYDTVNSTLTVSSGTLNLNANTDLRMKVGNNGGGTNIINLNGGSITSYSDNHATANGAGVVDLMNSGTADTTNTFNLNGGTLAIRAVITNNDTGTATFNFNGGTLKATGNDANFVNLGGTNQRADVKEGGAVMDSNGYNVTVVQPLLHGGAAATDGGLTKNGTGTLTLTGTNTYTGGTTLNAGTLALGSTGALGTTGTISMNGGTLQFSASNTTDYSDRLKIEDGKTATFDTNSQNVTFATALALGTGGTGALTKSGAGTLTLTGTNTFTGGIGITAGTLKVGESGSLGSGTYAGAISNAGMLHVSTSANQTLSGGISGSGSLAKDGTGTLTLSGGGTLKAAGISLYGGAFAAVLKEGTTRITGGAYDASATEWVVGGLDTGNGTNTRLVMDNDSQLINISWLSIGRGNGNGTASSDVTLNDTASITASSMSAGFNADNTATKPKGTITLNGSSSLTVTDYFHLAESAGSSMTLTLNDTAAVTLAGTPGGEDRRNLGLNGSGVLTLNAGTTFTDESTRYLNVGYQKGSGVVNINGGTFNKSSGELRVGTTSTNGVYTATGTINMTGGTATVGSLTLGRGNNNEAKVNGTLNVSGGTLTVTTGLAIVGYQGDGTAGGTLNITGGTFSANGASGTNSILIGTAGSGRGTVIVDGGTLNSLNDMVLAENVSSSGSVTLTSGTINLATNNEKWLKLNSGSSGNTSFTVEGGTLNLNNNSDLRFTPAGAATGTNTFTLKGGLVQGQTGNHNGVASATSVVDMNQAATGAATNTFNLDGGTLHIGQVLSSNTNGTRTFNFNGGTLKAAGTTTSFFNLGTGSARANVRNGGAIIDTAGFDATIAQALLHSNIDGDAATGGGLTKTGAGTLTLTGTSDYTGATNVNVGTLVVNGSLADTEVTVASGAKLAGSGTIGTDTNKAASVTIQAGGTHSPGNSPGSQTVNGDTTYADGSIFEWDINGNTNASGDRGAAGGYDGVTVTGELTVDSGSTFKVIQNSGTDFSMTFWDSNRAWDNIFSYGSLDGGWTANTPVSIFDTAGAPVDVSTEGYFTMTGTTLNWTMVPELSNLLIGGLLGVGLLMRRRPAAKDLAA